MKEKQDYNNTRMGDYIQNEGLHLKGGEGGGQFEKPSKFGTGFCITLYTEIISDGGATSGKFSHPPLI